MLRGEGVWYGCGDPKEGHRLMIMNTRSHSDRIVAILAHLKFDQNLGFFFFIFMLLRRSSINFKKKNPSFGQNSKWANNY